MATMRAIPGIVDVDTTLSVRQPELRVQINRQKASDLGIKVEDVASTLRTLVGGEPELMAYVGGLMGTPLDLRHSPWTLTLVQHEGQSQGQRAGQSAVVQWDVDAPDGTHSRTVHIADGSCKVETGTTASPRLTLTLTLPDFLRFVAGQPDGMQAFMSGKLKLGGDIMLAQTMQAWFAT